MVYHCQIRLSVVLPIVQQPSKMLLPKSLSTIYWLECRWATPFAANPSPFGLDHGLASRTRSNSFYPISPPFTWLNEATELFRHLPRRLIQCMTLARKHRTCSQPVQSNCYGNHLWSLLYFLKFRKFSAAIFTQGRRLFRRLF